MADPFAGLKPHQVAGLKAHIEEIVAKEKATLEALLEEATAAINAGTDVATASDTASVTAPPAEADANTLMTAVTAMHTSVSAFIVSIEAHARAAAQSADHGAHTEFSRLSQVFGEFRNALGSLLVK
jgi:hypothetical protein